MDHKVVYVGAQCIFGILLIVLYVFNRLNHRGQKLSMLDVVYYLVFTTIVLDSIWILINGNPAFRTWHVILQVVYLSVMAFMGYSWFLHTLELFPARSMKIRKYRYILGIPVLIEIVLIFMSIKTNWVFVVTPEGLYQRGDWHLYTILLNYIYMLLGSIIALRCRKEALLTIDRKRYLVAALFPIPALVLSAVQIILPPGVPAMQGGVIVSLLMLYGTSQNILITRDYLTGLPNRSAFESDLIGRIQKHHPESPEHLYLIEGDLDDFKAINDTYGHPEGDKALIVTAEILSKFFSQYDANVFRTGGDEFMVIMERKEKPDIHEMQDALNKRFSEFSDMQIAVNEKVSGVPESGGIVLSMSLGMREYVPGTDFRELITSVDNDLYDAKRSK